MDFQTIFDVKSLEDNELGHLEYIINSPSYSQVFEPYLQRMRNSLNLLLLSPSQERKDQYPDDFIRGGIIIIDGLLKFCKQLVEETEIERIARAQQALPEEEMYQYLKQEGYMKPVIGIQIPPEEDF